MGNVHRQPVLAGVLTVIVLMVSVINDKSFSDSYYVSKQFYFLIFVLPLIITYVSGELRSNFSRGWTVNLLDIFVALHFLYSLISAVKVSSLLSPSQEIIVHFLLVLMYAVVRNLCSQFSEIEKRRFLILLYELNFVDFSNFCLL